MIVALSSKGKDWNEEVDPRFGRADFLAIYDEDKDEISFLDNSDITSQAHGVGPLAAKKIVDNKVEVLITGNGPGGNAGSVLAKTGVQVYVGAAGMTLKAAYDAYKAGDLNKA